MLIKMDRRQFLRFKRRLKGWLFFGIEKDVDKGSKALARNYQKQITRGLDANGSPMKPVKESTMNSPIRWGGPDKRIRRTVNPARNRPIQATGASIKSIHSKQKSKREWEITHGAGKALKAFSLNRKLGRDPLQVTDKQIKIIEDAILDGFERTLLGV